MKLYHLVLSMGIALLLSSCASNGQIPVSMNQALNIMNTQVQRSSMQSQAPVTLINTFMDKLLIEDFNQSAKAVIPYVHKSLLSPDRRSLDGDTLAFSFKKAHENARFYQYPVSITRARKNHVTALGARSRGTAEAGSEISYFLAKKRSTDGAPAPLTVFFPADGSTPSISGMGSL